MRLVSPRDSCPPVSRPIDQCLLIALPSVAIVAADPRLECPTKYFLLRVTKRAWEDLDFRTRTVRFLRGAPDFDGHPLLVKFWMDCARVDAVDAGERIRGVEHPKVFRLKATGPGGSYRGAVWYDHESAVLWLLRVVTLSRFPNEQAAYAQFRTFEVRNYSGRRLSG